MMKLKETVFFKENGKIYEGLVVGFEGGAFNSILD